MYCGLGFEQLEVLTQGPKVAVEGKEIELDILIGAIEWHEPVIEVKDIKSTITYKNGRSGADQTYTVEEHDIIQDL